MRLVAWHLPTSLRPGGNGWPNRSSSGYWVRYHSLPIVFNLSFNSCITPRQRPVVSDVSTPHIKNFYGPLIDRSDLETWSRTYFGHPPMSDDHMDGLNERPSREAASYFRWGANRRRAFLDDINTARYACRWAWRQVVYKHTPSSQYDDKRRHRKRYRLRLLLKLISSISLLPLQLSKRITVADCIYLQNPCRI